MDKTNENPPAWRQFFDAFGNHTLWTTYGRTGNHITIEHLYEMFKQRLIADSAPEAGVPLRDYFAAKAMAALIAEPLNDGQASTVWLWTKHLSIDNAPVRVASAAYMMADAMLKAREEGDK